MSDLSINTTTLLNNGNRMPLLGLGVFRSAEGDELNKAIEWALDAGYRSFDTASVYKNETGLGKALQRTGIPRKDYFLTTKVWNSQQGYQKTLEAFEQSLNKLNTDYVDLYLVHWPVPGKYCETWKAMEEIYNSGRAKAIGVSNFLEHHLKDLFQQGTIKPMVNQVEFHPRLQQPGLHDFCEQNGIRYEAWSPIMRGKVAEIPELTKIARGHGKTEVQITLRWMLQLGVITIPKSVTKERIYSNADLFDFELTHEEMATISTLDTNTRQGAHPDDKEFYKKVIDV